MTTFRADMATGIFSVLDGYRAAHPDRLVRAYRARPSGLVDLPCAWVDSRPESIVHDSGTRTRTMTPSVLVVRDASDNAEDALAMDQLVDGLVDAFTAVPQFAPGTVWSSMSVADEELDVGGLLLPAVRMMWPNVTIQEGRP